MYTKKVSVKSIVCLFVCFEVFELGWQVNMKEVKRFHRRPR